MISPHSSLKFQANMNKAHRDRIAFMRVVSLRQVRGRMEVNHVQGGKKIRLPSPSSLMAAERETLRRPSPGISYGVSTPAFSLSATPLRSRQV